jgi:superfamily II DNA/RNA helicase
MKMAFERKRQNRKFIQLDLFIEISRSAIVFATIVMLQNALVYVERKGIYATYHGGMDQDERERANQFRNGSVSYLINNLAARGLDIPEMNHVIHYHLPSKKTNSRIETDVQHVC